MFNQSQKVELGEFLDIMAGSKEVGLVIAKDTEELEDFNRSMNDSGFKRVEEIADLFKFSKTFVTINENMSKDVYDFVVQYPTGQIEIFDKELMQSQIFSPDYNRSVVLLVIKNDLNKLRSRGFNLLSLVGPAYQSREEAGLSMEQV